MERKKFEFWQEVAPCDMCGEDAWGVEMRNEELAGIDETMQLCKKCLLKLARETGD